MNFRHALDHHFLHCAYGLGWTRSLATTTVQRSRVGQANPQNIEKISRHNPRSVQRPRLGQANTASIPRRTENANSRRNRPDSSKRTSTAKPPDTESAKRLLEPYVLSSRLRKLCDEGQIDTAIAMLKSSAMGAQNTPVWNTVIWECMKAKRYGSAYKMFTDVRARPLPSTS